MVTDSENRGTTATCSKAVATSPVSAACHFSISSRVSRMASSSLVISAAGRVGSDGLDPAAADDPQSAALGLGEQRVLGVREGRPEDHGRGGAGRDPPVAEFGGRRCGEIRVGETGLGREDAGIQPFQQLPTAVGVTAVGLREMHVGVDESG